jgi:hypothetical protein
MHHRAAARNGRAALAGAVLIVQAQGAPAHGRRVGAAAGEYKSRILDKHGPKRQGWLLYRGGPLAPWWWQPRVLLRMHRLPPRRRARPTG